MMHFFAVKGVRIAPVRTKMAKSANGASKNRGFQSKWRQFTLGAIFYIQRTGISLRKARGFANASVVSYV